MTCKLHYRTDDYEVQIRGQVYVCDVEAVAIETHEPGCMYKRNGDPGDPPVDEFDIDTVTLNDVKDENGNDVTDEDLLDEIENVITDELAENPDWFEYEEEEEEEEEEE